MPSSVITIKSEDQDVVPSVPSGLGRKTNARITRLREVLLQKSSPVCRFRAEAYWKIGTAFLLNNNNNNNHEPTRNNTTVFIISVRAIGPRSKIEQDSTLALYTALKFLDINPKLIQRQELDFSWFNNWLVHINPQDAARLPSFTNQHQGIFWNPTDDLFLFIWNIVPLNPQEEEHLQGRFLTFEAHIPALVPYNSPIPEDLWDDIKIEPPESNSLPLSITSAKFVTEKIGETIIKNGNFTIQVDKIPDTYKFRTFLRNTNNNPNNNTNTNNNNNNNNSSNSSKNNGNIGNNNKSLTGWWKGKYEFKMELMPSCSTCGAEGHSNSTCIYKFTLQNLILKIDQIRLISNNNHHFNHHHQNDGLIGSSCRTPGKRKSLASTTSSTSSSSIIPSTTTPLNNPLHPLPPPPSGPSSSSFHNHNHNHNHNHHKKNKSAVDRLRLKKSSSSKKN